MLLGYGLVWGWTMNTLLDLYHLEPFASWRAYQRERGMSPWWDIVDWIGGWPYECATPDAALRFYGDRRFVLRKLVIRQSHGCNEFIFARQSES